MKTCQILLIPCLIILLTSCSQKTINDEASCIENCINIPSEKCKSYDKNSRDWLICYDNHSPMIDICATQCRIKHGSTSATTVTSTNTNTLPFNTNPDQTYIDLVQTICEEIISYNCNKFKVKYYARISGSTTVDKNTFYKSCINRDYRVICDIKCYYNRECNSGYESEYLNCRNKCENTLFNAYSKTSMYKQAQEANNQQVRKYREEQARKQAAEEANAKRIKEALAYSIGPHDAKVNITLYVDYNQNACDVYTITNYIINKKYDDIVKVVLKQYPNPWDSSSVLSSEAVLAAGAQGTSKFWDMNQLLCKQKSRISSPKREELIKYAKTIGLNISKFTQDIDSHSFKAQIELESKAAKLNGIKEAHQLDGIVINGKPIGGSISYIYNAIDTAVAPYISIQRSRKTDIAQRSRKTDIAKTQVHKQSDHKRTDWLAKRKSDEELKINKVREKQNMIIQTKKELSDLLRRGPEKGTWENESCLCRCLRSGLIVKLVNQIEGKNIQPDANVTMTCRNKSNNIHIETCRPFCKERSIYSLYKSKDELYK